MLAFYFYEYLILLFFLIFVISIASIFFFLSVGTKYFEFFFSDKAKLSKYECGFEALRFLKYKRENFDIKFFLIGVLFIVFDLEIIFLLPWAVALSEISFAGVITMHWFLLLMGLGFLYEYKKGALIW